MGRKWLGVVALVAVAAVAAAVSRSGDRPAKPRTPSGASQRVGDDADLMRRLERKKLVGQSR